MMKRLLRTFFFLFVLFLTASCGVDAADSSDPKPDPPSPVIPDEIVFPAGNAPAPVFTDTGGKQTISFTASGTWTASVSNTRADGWCSLSPDGGPAGQAALTVETQPNSTYDERSAVITIKSGTAEKSIVVTQKQLDALTLTQSRFEIGAEGGEITVEAGHNVDFGVEIGAGWITQVATRALETATLRFRIAPNEAVARREGSITLSGSGLSETVTVFQAGAEPTILLTQNAYAVSSAEETIRVEVASNVDVEVSVPDAGWITENRTRALSTHTYFFTVAENDTFDARSGEIRFLCREKGLSETVTVTQMQRDALVVANPSYTVDTAGGEIEVEVVHNVDFDIEIGAGWITQIATRALVTDRLRFRIAENPAYDNREAAIAFISKDKTLRQEVKVVQEGTAKAEDARIREFLVKLYNDTDGDHWTNNTNWCSDRPVGEWYGIDYSDGKLVVFLVDNNLQGTIDLSACLQITELYCGNNRLNGLNVSYCTGLTVLDCRYNQLNQLLVSGCAFLTKLYGFGNRLTELDITGCNALVDLDCDENRITSLDISGHTALVNLWCSYNEMNSLNVSGCTALKAVDCNNPLTSLNISDCISLTKIPDSRILTYLNASGCKSVTEFSSNYCQLEYLDIAGCTALRSVSCYGNKLKILNASGCSGLDMLLCNDNQLEELFVTGCRALTYLDCEKNRLTGLNVSENENLAYMKCNVNLLTTLDVSDHAALRELWFSDNPLTKLNASNCTALSGLVCHSGKLTSLDVAGCTSLKGLNCSNNNLMYLNITGCNALTNLLCGDNNLTYTVGLYDCTAIRYADYRNNKIFQEIPSSFQATGQCFGRGFYDEFQIDGFRYEYYEVWDEALKKNITCYRDLGVGWWYPGEPGSRKHDW